MRASTFVAALAALAAPAAARWHVVEPRDPAGFRFDPARVPGDMLVSAPGLSSEPTGGGASAGTDPEMESRFQGSPLARLGPRGVATPSLSSSLRAETGPALDTNPEDGASAQLTPPEDQWADGEVHDGILLREAPTAAPTPAAAALQDPQDAVVDVALTPRGDLDRTAEVSIPEPGPELGGGRGVMGMPGGDFAPDFTVEGRQEYSFDPTIPNTHQYGADYHDSIDPYEHTGSTKSQEKALKRHKRKVAKLHHNQ
eukprot:TRINITY_DN5275_c1_g7_i1.p1 TRINITY_DN5275_c1_g7~~TRINITY_DN5275_c1_g7_i1.p1  ORF type:complete len:298 (-),score=110.62 TRINITY_DN5275_c1_g7_i1:88-855(-)